MALLYQAQLAPSKIEMLMSWIPSRPWRADVDTSALEPVGAYRFDDPDGEVGIETHLVRAAGGQVIQTPVTYRGAPLEDAESSLITTMQHSELGKRWVYDACGDPVYVRALAETILTGGSEAELELATEPGRPGEKTAWVRGSGTPGTEVPPVGAVRHEAGEGVSVITSEGIELVVLHLPVDDATGDDLPGAHSLTGTWTGSDKPALLARAEVSASAG